MYLFLTILFLNIFDYEYFNEELNNVINKSNETLVYDVVTSGIISTK